MTETICRQCRHLHDNAVEGKPWLWLCTAAPVVPRTNYVDGSLTPPWQFCKTLNPVGACANYEPGINKFNPKETTNAA